MLKPVTNLNYKQLIVSMFYDLKLFQSLVLILLKGTKL